MKASQEKSFSDHELKVFLALKGASTCAIESDQWMTNVQLEQVTGVVGRTVRKHTMHFATIGIVETTTTYPAHKYRLRALEAVKGKKSQAYYAHLEKVSATVALPKESEAVAAI